ncbi:MAG: sulfotransferase, partial [Pseudomonadota bacterium]
MAIPKRYEDRSRAELVVKGALEEVQSLVAPARGDPPVRFCIYGQGRTGSTLLTSLLDSHPDITCPDEILRRPKVAPLAYLRRRMRQAETRAFGFHVKFRQIEYFARVPDQRAFLDALEAEGWRFVYLRRADLFAQCFSNAFARELRQFHFTEEEGPPKDRRIEIRPAKLVRDIERRIHWGEAERAALEGRLHFEIV